MIDGNKQSIQWKSMQLENKLRNAHINYNKQKMKVWLADQIFNKSVADLLSFSKNNLMLKKFEGCKETINFLLSFDDLFNI